MLLTKIIVSGYKSISYEHPQTIELDPELTVFIGHNGTGKSAALEALNKLFAIDLSLRNIVPSDFHMPANADSNTPRRLTIEAWFTLTNTEGNPSIPSLINGLTASSSTGEIIFRVLLEASLTFDYNPLGDVDENIWVVSGDMKEPEEENKHRLSATQRNAIQITYIPANRDPLSQLKYSSKAILGRLLKAIKWTEGEKDSFENQAQELNQLAGANPALAQITNAINDNWQKIYNGRHLNQAELNFPVSDVDDILRLIQLKFMPDATGNKVDTTRLSDGQKSLVYFALTKALFDIDKATRKAVIDRKHSNFDADKMRLPIFSLIVLEEPENHLSPHYLGRIIQLVKDYSATDMCQSIISTHSASLVGRIEPSQIRHFRLDNDNLCTQVQSLKLPKDSDEHAKYVSEAVKAYPEIYFAKLVILGEGDSEQVIIPRLIKHYGKDVDAHSISIVPLGGRHVNHFWRLLHSLKIPYITLLDFDIDRNGGGFGRIKYAVQQISNFGPRVKYLHSDMLEYIPDWTCDENPNDFCLTFNDKSKINIVRQLEKKHVFFSNPLDIDYSMICAFPEIFCVKDEIYGERGPTEGKKDEEDEDVTLRQDSLIKAVLKKGNIGKRFAFGEDWERNFLWYRYRFLSNKSKPASHVRMFAKLEDTYSSEEIITRLPPELTRLMKRVLELTEQVVE